MHPAVSALVRSLSGGMPNGPSHEEGQNTAISRLARVYEIARNAMEYRADHLVRRAAIERILKRQLVFGQTPADLADQLIVELKWAMYVTEVEEKSIPKHELELILNKLKMETENSKLNKEWLVGMISAEIEEKLNPNSDYHRFTNFAYHVFRSRVRLENIENLDLVLFVAIDSIYSQSDEQQISYHLYKLIKSQSEKVAQEDEVQIATETWKHYEAAMSSPVLNKIMAYVRRQMGPLVLLRDIYFTKPQQFAQILEHKESFINEAGMTLQSQLLLMRRRINTATWRSLTYVFLTKMLVVLLIEIPLERLFTGRVSYGLMGLNVLIPVAVMWLMTSSIKLPQQNDQEKLIEKAWSIVSEFDALPVESEILTNQRKSSIVGGAIFYTFYGLLFVGIFTLIIWGLLKVGYNLVSVSIFLFFLSVVSFFAYRIGQTAQVYLYKGNRMGRTSFTDAAMLPIVVAGRVLSAGVSKFNFLILVFDFILEAPFKMILRFLDNWMSFLANKRDEAVG